MPKLIMTKGLPGSGKSTLAKNIVKKGQGKWKRINKDDLRAMMDNSHHSKQNEWYVMKVRDFIVKLALEHGESAIVDDTNLNPKHEEVLRGIARECKAEFEVLDLTKVSPEVCIRQDLQRLNSVGKDVIMRMYNQYLKPKPEQAPEHNPDVPDVIICDIDGTAANLNGRFPYDFDKVDEDLPNQTVIDILHKFSGLEIIFVSGRNDSCRPKTNDWLDKHVGKDKWSELFMRRTGDNRHDFIVKKEIYDTYIKYNYNVLFVLDDRQSVVDMWRQLGLTCLQVAPGDF